MNAPQASQNASSAISQGSSSQSWRFAHRRSATIHSGIGRMIMMALNRSRYIQSLATMTETSSMVPMTSTGWMLAWNQNLAVRLPDPEVVVELVSGWLLPIGSTCSLIQLKLLGVVLKNLNTSSNAKTSPFLFRFCRPEKGSARTEFDVQRSGKMSVFQVFEKCVSWRGRRRKELSGSGAALSAIHAAKCPICKQRRRQMRADFFSV